jgi:hypothetical protein
MITTAVDIDLCDRCDTLAYGRVVMPSGRRLAFCGLHMHEHSEALAQQGARLDAVAKQPEYTRVINGKVVQ